MAYNNCYYLACDRLERVSRGSGETKQHHAAYRWLCDTVALLCYVASGLAAAGWRDGQLERVLADRLGNCCSNSQPAEPVVAAVLYDRCGAAVLFNGRLASPVVHE
ncbi:hypothetical protein D3C84_876080 [compost metagenome]